MPPDVLQDPHAEIMEVAPQTKRRVLGSDACPELLAGEMTRVGITEVVDYYRFDRPFPRFGQVLVTIEGAGEVLEGGRWRRCEAGHAYVTPEHAHHAYHRFSGEPWKFAWAHLRPGVVRFQEPQVMPAEVRPFMTAIGGLQDEVDGMGLPAASLCWVRLIEIASKRIQGEYARAGSVADAWSRVAEDLGRAWTLAEIAGTAHLSVEQFRRRCDEVYQRGPREHLALLRMRRASDLLTSTNLKLEVIAGLVGYADAFGFSAAFKRVMGRPPSVFREKR